MTNNSFQYHTISVTPTFITISRSWFFKTHQAVPRLYRKDKKKPSCAFLCLLEDHPACRESPFATMDLLRGNLGNSCSTAER